MGRLSPLMVNLMTRFFYALTVWISLAVSHLAIANEAQLGAQVSKTGDNWIGTVTGSLQATEQINVSAEIDSTGYLEIGTGYGLMLGQFYTEAFASYGRADSIDIYDAGVFSGTALTETVMLYASTSHEWRKTKTMLDLDWFDQREWKTTLGISYSPLPWLNTSYSFNHDRLLSGDRFSQDIINDNINSHDVTITFKPKWVEPYIKYTYGEYRARPGEQITSDSTIEAGINFRFK